MAVKASLPKVIKIGYRDYTVEKVDDLMAEEEAEWGCIRPDPAEMKIQSEQSPNDEANTVLHECMHGIWDLAGLKQVLKSDPKTADELDNVEEIVVRTLANGISEVFKRNPQFLKWFYENAK